MKKLSEVYKELGIDFSFPIEIKDDSGRVTYSEDGDDFWCKYERDVKGRPTYHEDSNGFWQRWKRNADGDVLYYEDSTGVKRGNPKSAKTLLEEPTLQELIDLHKNPKEKNYVKLI